MKNTPEPTEPTPTHLTKTFRLSIETVDLLNDLVKRFSAEVGFAIPMGKVVEIALWQIKDTHLKTLMK